MKQQHNARRLTEIEISQIQSMIVSGISKSAISRMFNVSTRTIANIAASMLLLNSK